MSKVKSQINLPWVEKYRPKDLSELVSQESIVSTIQKFMQQNRLPHLLFYGPPGTGKTSTALAIAKQIYAPREFAQMILELNASDDRGIGVVRNEILNFASTKSIFKSGFKMIILDECDAMTNDAQNALRRIIEKYTENTRFFLICNYLNKIIPALQSRCTRFRYGPLSNAQIIPRLDFVIESENVNVTEDGKKALIRLACGDMRRVINVLQSTSMAFDTIDEKNVYLCCGQPMRTDVKQIVEYLLNESINSGQKKIFDMQSEKGIALADIITQVHPYIEKNDFQLPLKIRLDILIKLADIEYHLSSGGSEKLQLSALIGAFQVARDHHSDEPMN